MKRFSATELSWSTIKKTLSIDRYYFRLDCQVRSVLCDSLIASDGSDTVGEADVSVQTRLVSVTRTLDKHPY